MSTRRRNPNLTKVNRNYTFEELAGVLGVYKNTVSQRVKSVLPCLALGVEARRNLQKYRGANKQICKANELLCTCSKRPAQPAENFVEYVPISLAKGRLGGVHEQR